MFYSITGEVVVKDQSFVVLSTGGVAYKLYCSLNTVTAVPSVGNTATLYTHLYVREDIFDLYGFFDINELNAFKMLTSVSGVGVKVALAILSDLTYDKVALAIVSGDEKTLTKSNGVGKKVAQRIILELKDKLGGSIIPDAVSGGGSVVLNDNSSKQKEAVAALSVLGYSQSEASLIIGRMDESLSVEDMIKLALKQLGGSK